MTRRKLPFRHRFAREFLFIVITVASAVLLSYFVLVLKF